MGLHAIVVLSIIKELRWKYRFSAWQQGWGLLLTAMAFIGIRRILSFFDVFGTVVWLDAVDAPFVSFFLALGFWKLANIFHQELPALLIPTARVAIDSN